jgi:hypothetical protein
MDNEITNLPADWLEWLRGMSETRRRSMQSIIFESYCPKLVTA